MKKIIHKTCDKDLCRRATAVLLVLKGKAKAEVARLLQAGRSSVNRWFTWYEAAGIDGLTNQRTGRPPTQPKALIIVSSSPEILAINGHAGVRSC